MSIGIMDADISQYVLVPFNMDAMQLSAYYKNKREIVNLATQFTPERNSKFFYIKDWDDGAYPPSLATEPNVEYRGHAFSGDKFVPMDLDIHRMKPDRQLYAPFREIFCKTYPKRARIFDELMFAEHIRMSVDGETIWKEHSRQIIDSYHSRLLILHDYDLNKFPDAIKYINKITMRMRDDKTGTRVGFKFPPQLYNGADLLKWSELRPHSQFFMLEYHGIIDDDSFLKWVDGGREKAIFSTLAYDITPQGFDEDKFVKEDLPKILRQVIISRTHRTFFSLKYDEKKFRTSEWARLIDLLNFYENSMKAEPQSKYYQKISGDTLADFAKHTLSFPSAKYAKMFTRQEIREIFYFVREVSPDLFHMFYELNYDELKGGKYDII